MSVPGNIQITVEIISFLIYFRNFICQLTRDKCVAQKLQNRHQRIFACYCCSTSSTRPADLKEKVKKCVNIMLRSPEKHFSQKLVMHSSLENLNQYTKIGNQTWVFGRELMSVRLKTNETFVNETPLSQPVGTCSAEWNTIDRGFVKYSSVLKDFK